METGHSKGSEGQCMLQPPIEFHEHWYGVDAVAALHYSNKKRPPHRTKDKRNKFCGTFFNKNETGWTNMICAWYI